MELCQENGHLFEKYKEKVKIKEHYQPRKKQQEHAQIS